MGGSEGSIRAFRVLGPVGAVVAGAEAELGGPRQRALLALLLLDPGNPVAASWLAEELWQGEPPPSAASTLYSYISRLRRALGREAVVAQAGGYALAVDRGSVDAPRFEELLAEGREALARGAAGLAAERLAAALALWRGPALADVRENGEALAAEARRLEELRLVCVEERIEADLALGRHKEVVPELQSLVRVEPLRERLWRQLVLALYRSQRQGEALAAYREARRVLSELGLEPGEELRQLEREILRQEVPAVATADARHNLPEPETSFVGREEELEEIGGLLREHRLVTLSGLGGSGKTRLALEIGRRKAGAFAAGVWLADLTALARPELVVGAVATALGASEPEVDAVAAHVGKRELLLVLDNCEHVVDACADLAGELLRSCAGVRILATSRVALGLPGEVDFALSPLPVADAVELFVARAATVSRDLPADADALETVAEICRELDGVPLAIELAAARVKALSLGEICARLDDRFRFLRAWQRLADPRHRTLQTTMDWSYDLLAPEEQELLRRLAVFAGGATLEAVAAVCLAGDENAAADLLERLVGASLVVVEREDSQSRFRLLETVRQYAAAKLAEDSGAAELHRRHALHYLELAESANLSVDSLGRGEQRPELALREQHNLRAALDWATEADVELGLRLMVSLENFWVAQAPREGERRYGELLERAADVPVGLRASAMRDYGAMHDLQGDVERARELYEESGRLAAEAGDEIGVANARFRVGVVHALAGDIDSARALWEECLEEYRRLDYPIGELQAIGNLGGLELEFGDVERGRAMTSEAAAAAREVGWWWWVARVHASLAETAVLAGRADEAESEARELLAISWRSANLQESSFALAILARAAALRGDDERARVLWRAVDAVEDSGSRFGRFDREEWATHIPDGPPVEPLPFADAVALALLD